MVLEIISWAIVLRCILSWFPNFSNNIIGKTLYDFTEPLIKPFRRIKFGSSMMMIDFAPFFAILVIWLIQSFILPFVFKLLLNYLPV